MDHMDEPTFEELEHDTAPMWTDDEEYGSYLEDVSDEDDEYDREEDYWKWSNRL